MDTNGFLYIIDRIKNMYISGGENVYPAEVERILKSHPDIHEVIITRVPDKKWGEVGYAFIVSSQRDISKIQSYCKENLSKYKIPKFIKFYDSLPKTETGKIDRKFLQATAIKSINKNITL